MTLSDFLCHPTLALPDWQKVHLVPLASVLFPSVAVADVAKEVYDFKC